MFKNWTYVQFEKVDDKAWIFRIKDFYNKVDQIDFVKILETYMCHLNLGDRGRTSRLRGRTEHIC